MDFSVVLPFKGDPEEVDHARVTVPAILALGPSEVIIAADRISDRNRKAVEALRGAFGDFQQYRIMEFDHNPKWNFHLAYITDACIRAAAHPRVLLCNVDERPLPAVLECAGFLGISGTAISGGQAFPHEAEHRAASVRALMEQRIKDGTAASGMIGTLWIWRPYYEEIVKEEGFSRVLDGSDAYIEMAVRKSRFRAVPLPDIIATLLEPGHMTLPKVDFFHGLFVRVNYNSGWRFGVGIRHFLHGSPWFRKGWIFAVLHPRHPLVRSLRGLYMDEAICYFKITSISPLRYETSWPQEQAGRPRTESAA